MPIINSFEVAVSGALSNVIYLFPSERERSHSSTSSHQLGVANRHHEMLELQDVIGRLDKETNRGGPTTDLYSVPQVERLLGISSGRLRYWARTGFIIPTGRLRGKRYYTFQDLVALRAVAGLLRRGLTTRQIRRALHAVREKLPHLSSPLAEASLTNEGEAVVVRDKNKRFEAESGQLVFDFDLEELRRQVVELIHPKRPGAAQRQRAFDHYLEGCRLEAQPEDLDRAEQAYRRAIDLDPELACAYTNLGNLRYRAGAANDAKVLYEKAIELEPSQPEAQYNLAFLSYEEGFLEEAVERFQVALKLDPDFSDAHFNLAVTLSELDRAEEALVHYTAYLELEPYGPWADLAHEEIDG